MRFKKRYDAVFQKQNILEAVQQIIRSQRKSYTRSKYTKVEHLCLVKIKDLQSIYFVDSFSSSPLGLFGFMGISPVGIICFIS